jgi:hypothetical protein
LRRPRRRDLAAVADWAIAFMIADDGALGPLCRQEWLGMNPTTPIILSGINAPRMPGFFKTRARAFEGFPHDADAPLPEWRAMLGKAAA